MKEFFLEIFEYHHYFNHLLIDQIELHQDALPQRAYPLLCHILNACQVWNSRILLSSAPGVHQMHTFDECRQMNDTIFNDVQAILDSRNLDEVIQYKNSAGFEFANSTRDILFHAANHATHHKAQIISDFRLSGIEPLITDYIFYKRQQA